MSYRFADSLQVGSGWNWFHPDAAHKLHMFWTVPLSIIRSISPYTQRWYMSYSFADSLWAESEQNWLHPDPPHNLSANLYDIYPCCVYSDGQRNCPKNVEFYSQNKFEKLVHLVGFIIRITTTGAIKDCEFKTLSMWLHWAFVIISTLKVAL